MKNKIKKIFKKIKLKIKKMRWFDWVRNVLWLGLIVASFFTIWVPIVLLGIVLIVGIFSYFQNKKSLRLARGNGIIYGPRGAGKGILLNYITRHDKTNPIINVPYHDLEVLEDMTRYLDSLRPLTIDNFINNDINFIDKDNFFEGRNVYIDDVNVYLPNWADSSLKKRFPSMPPMLAINRHLYDAYCVITTQDRERPYKILKELQSDFSIKARKTLGFGPIWQCIPILNSFVYTRYIYHEMPKSADMLPFKAKAVVNETLKHGYLTSGQATKEVYEATHGKIIGGYVLQFKKHLNYDTRYFHKVVYGKPAPTFEERLKIKKQNIDNRTANDNETTTNN